MKVLLTATVQSHICQFHKPLVELLHSYGHEVHVAARDNLAEKNGLKLDFVDKVYNIPFARSPKSTDNIIAYKELKRIIKNECFDVIHCNTPMGGIITRLASINVRKNGTKVYYTAHGFHFYKGAPKKNWVFFYPIEKLFSRVTDKIITITQEDYDLAKRKFHCDVCHIHGVGVNSSKFYAISEEDRNELKSDLGYQHDTKIILNVGELLPNKNQKAVILAVELLVKKYQNIKLLIAGNGSEYKALSNLIKEKNLNENVTLLGYTTELQKYMNISDVLVACSYREGLPLNLMEAMLCKIPIVASNNRGHRELVKSNRTGYIVEPDDIEQYANCIDKIVGCDDHKTYLGEEGYKYVFNFTDKNVKEELKILYDL